jgi:hypothetical protein
VNTTQADRVQALCDYIERLRPTVTTAPDAVTLPTADIVREAIAGSLNTRTGRPLASAPPRDKRPVANVLWRLLAWHRSSGNLGAIFAARWDCDDIVTARNLDMTGPELHDALDTLALLLTGGRSRAGDAWARALGR